MVCACHLGFEVQQLPLQQGSCTRQVLRQDDLHFNILPAVSQPCVSSCQLCHNVMCHMMCHHNSCITRLTDIYPATVLSSDQHFLYPSYNKLIFSLVIAARGRATRLNSWFPFLPDFSGGADFRESLGLGLRRCSRYSWCSWGSCRHNDAVMN